MQANAYSPYALKDLHQAIDLIDRKIAYGKTGENFESLEAREIHLRKLSSKRAALVKSAQALTNLGVRCDPRFLPRSFTDAAAQGEPISVAATPVAASGTTSKKPSRPRQKAG